MNEQYFPIHTEGMRKGAVSVVSGVPLPFEVIVQPLKKKRSDAQNRLYWRWLTDISRQMEVPDENGELKKLSKEEWHHVCGMKFIGIKTIRIGQWETPLPSKSTTKLKVGEFAEYLTKIEAHFIPKGVQLTLTDDYTTAMGER